MANETTDGTEQEPQAEAATEVPTPVVKRRASATPAAGAREQYHGLGRRKTSVARVLLRPVVTLADPDRVATRVRIAALDIDLPVVKGPSGYPYCNVAMYLTDLHQPGQGNDHHQLD